MRKNYLIALAMLIIVILIIVFLLYNNQNKSDILLYTAGCQSEKIDDSVYSLAGNTSLIGAFISFQTVPLSDENKAVLKDYNINLQENTWIFDYVLAQIPTDSLCLIAEEDFVKQIFIPSNKK